MQITLIFALILIVILYVLIKPKPKPKIKYPTLDDIQRKYPKRKYVEVPNDGIYEDFSRELALVESETIDLEISENSYKTLVKIVCGYEDIAVTLIQENLQKYPKKSATWACEKAIADLERHRQ